MTALADPARGELPPKIGLHPRPADSFAHAMPAHLRGDSAADDLLGVKWVLGFNGNTARGLPSISAVVVVNDPVTGIPTAILDGSPITAERTAAVTGIALRHYAPAAGEPASVALIGAGTQAHAHVPVIAHVLPGSTLNVFTPNPGSAKRFARWAANHVGIADAVVHATARDAVANADIVITTAPFTSPDRRQSMTNAWLRPGATVVPVDYATYCAAEVARDAALFLVDHREQFLANRDAGNFDGYPEPTAMLGEAILARTPRPEGRVVITHLGVGLADVVFADAIVTAATAAGRGTTLPR
jgi:ornithine cyclodeaminase/alanine dehydrogenase-like protein (mu-crystallin family)